MSSSEQNTNNHTQGIRISNLDSTDQATTWRKIVFPSGCASDDKTKILWDASSHACEFEIHNNSRLVEYFAQCLRTAYLSHKRITLTYQEVLDGTFFLAFGPENVNHILGLSYRDEPAIHIRTYTEKHKTLKDALINSFTTCSEDGIYSINPAFEPACLIACPALYEAARSSSHTPAQLPQGFEQSKDYIEFLEEALEKTYKLKSGQLSFLAQRWKEWINAADQGTVKFVPKDCHVDKFDLSSQFARVEPVLDDYLFASGLAQACQEKIREAVKHPQRSVAFAQLNEIFDNPHYNNRPAAHTFARELYQYVYQMALAKQYQCTLMTVQDAEDDTRIHDNVFVEKFKDYIKNQPQKKYNYCSVSGKTSTIVGQIPAAYFTSILYTSRGAIDFWRTAQGASKVKAAKELDYAIKNAASQNNRADDIKLTIIRGGIAIILAIIGWIIDQWQFDGNGGIFLSASIAFLISVGPEIVNLVNSLREITQGPETFFAEF
ncbi:MAG: hypothetical protein E6514_00285 [Alloscardovia omnicolens]|nr:hypothetical protein [Alloscardovia omnicolens]